ncbi:MAG: protein TolQ [Gammaproteobacteria bacterium]|nr:protein TolQ [Gammaproteobacteria bacterium]
MNADMSVWTLVADAGPIVKLVMLSLVAASVWSWMIIVIKAKQFQQSKSVSVEFENQFSQVDDLAEIYKKQRQSKAPLYAVPKLFYAGFEEYSRLVRAGSVGEVLVDGVRRSMRVQFNREIDKLEANLPILATVGSVSPYVGLFGTVWGIMTAFIGLGSVQQVTLAVVAPGIAEALIATAVGLFAAIPAVVAYNRYTAQMERLASQYETFCEEFLALLHRQAHASRS